jgi:hypothetical protein
LLILPALESQVRNDARLWDRREEGQVVQINNDINVLHHLGIISRDLEAAVKQYERLGFVFTPLSAPQDSLAARREP